MKMITSEFRLRRLETFHKIAEKLQSRRSDVIGALRKVESKATALDEFEKTIRALKTYELELPELESRSSYGDVAIFLPFNNPLYSFVLYAFGSSLGGSKVLVRPSRITFHVFQQIKSLIEFELKSLGINVYTGTGADFIQYVREADSIKTVIFTGNWESFSSLSQAFSNKRKIIYCGAGVSPFIICQDALDYMSLQEIVKLAIESKLYNSGQDCLCAERFYVHLSLRREFVRELLLQLKEVKSGFMSDDSATVTPLLGNGSERIKSVVAKSSGTWLLEFRSSEDLVLPSVIEVPLGSSLLYEEKYAPLFVIATYTSNEQLESELESEYRFGLTIVGGYDSEVLRSYPHISRTNTVISSESEDAHQYFGGRGKSGMVLEKGEHLDGPILFSIETTETNFLNKGS